MVTISSSSHPEKKQFRTIRITCPIHPNISPEFFFKYKQSLQVTEDEVLYNIVHDGGYVVSNYLTAKT